MNTQTKMKKTNHRLRSRVALLVLAITLTLAALVLAAGAPEALAHGVTCVGGKNTFSVTVTPGLFPDEDGDGVICGTLKHDGTTVFKDDHGFPSGH
jgi:hypothetical protein